MTTYKAKRPKNKSKKQQLLAHRYKCAYNYLFERLDKWKKDILVEHPIESLTERGTAIEQEVVKAFTKEVAMLAESNREIPDMKND